MDKVSFFQATEELGPAAIPLFGPADSYFEKTASAQLLPEVANYIAKLRPRNDAQYVLVNAMGAGEYYGSNINGDRFAEAALIHRPDGWKGIPQVDALLARDWPYGFPTFYNAHVYPHHRNKDSSKALGVVELAAWNPHMKRVELVTRLDQDKCARHGGQAIWDKLRHATEFPDVSMGTKVPFDTCSITLDRNLYQKAWQTFDPAKHKSPGDAILAFHKKLKAENGVGIRGVSITRKDYSEYASTMMNRILPDGRKVWVDNDFPRFFDISYVFIGADKIAKAMLKIASLGKCYFFMGGAEAAELARTGELEEKLASAGEGPCKAAEISKEVVPNSLAAKAVPVLTEREQDLPEEALRLLEAQPLERALATTTALGVVLRPAEFQRIVLVQAGKRPLSQSLAGLNQLFPRTEEKEEVSFSSKDFSSSLAEALAPLLLDRSAFGPVIEHRVVVVRGKPPRENLEKSSHSSELLRKIGAAYNGYRDTLMQVVADAQDMLGGSQGASPLRKLASAQVTTLFTPLSFHYLRDAFMDEIPEDKEAAVRAIAGVQRGSPLVTTR